MIESRKFKSYTELCLRKAPSYTRRRQKAQGGIPNERCQTPSWQRLQAGVYAKAHDSFGCEIAAVANGAAEKMISCSNQRKREFIFYICVVCVMLYYFDSRKIEQTFIVPQVHGSYCIVPYAFPVKQDDNESKTIALCMHSSLEYLHHIFTQVDTWEGELSLSVFIESDVNYSLALVALLFACDEKLSSVSVHIVFPRSVIDSACPRIPLIAPQCEGYSRDQVLTLLAPIQRATVYPINIMRNTARRGARAPYHLISDIEMVFSSGAARQIAQFVPGILQQRPKVVFIVRRFEVRDDVATPSTVEELQEFFLANGSVIEFHAQYFPLGHRIPYIYSWLKTSVETAEISATLVPYTDSLWEPQVLLRASDPLHDETIPERHRDHQALIYELCRSGHRFFVLTHVFSVHRGIKSKPSLLEKEVALLGEKQADEAGERFFHRMNRLYPSTMIKCTPWKRKPGPMTPKATTTTERTTS